jgi:hypothetical protein
MALPATVRVKISDEAGGSISFSPVVVKEMPFRELVEIALIAAGGKSAERIAEHLSRGSLVSGASRFRWEGVQVDPQAVAAILSSFPDPDPSVPFEPGLCRAVLVRTRASGMTLPVETLSRKRVFRRRSFFDALVEVARGVELEYGGYSYRDRADSFRLPMDAGIREGLSAALPLLVPGALRDQLTAEAIVALEFQVTRRG